MVDNHVQFFYMQGQSQLLDENNFAFYNIWLIDRVVSLLLYAFWRGGGRAVIVARARSTARACEWGKRRPSDAQTSVWNHRVDNSSPYILGRPFIYIK